ncbi:MAG: hypothetical protein QM487_01155 [Candidatus Marithrix sp.]
MKFTKIEEKTKCSCCNGSNVLWIKDSLGCANRVKCNHNKYSILDKLEQNKSYIEGTKHDFRIKKVYKPPTISLNERLKILRNKGER